MSLGHFVWLMWGGLRFDLVTLLYFNVLYVLLMVLPIDLRFNHYYKKVSKYIFFSTNGVMLAVNVSDFIYYKFTLRRTTADVFQQFENEANVAALWFRFLLDYWYAFLFWVALMAVLVIVYNRIPCIRDHN